MAVGIQGVQQFGPMTLTGDITGAGYSITGINSIEDLYYVYTSMIRPRSLGEDIRIFLSGSAGLRFDSPDEILSSFKIKTVDINKLHNSDLFDAAALIDNVVIWQQPAGAVLLGIKGYLKTQFASTSSLITDLDVTVGLAGDPDGLLAAAMNLTSDAATTEYKTRGAYWNEAASIGFLAKDAATDWIAYATAVGANLNTTTAGELVFVISYIEP